MKKIVWIYLLLAVTVFFTGCRISENGSQGSNTDSRPEDSGNEDTSEISNDFEVHEEEYVFDEGKDNEFKVKYAQVSGINNKDLERDINQVLKLAVTEWLNEESYWMEEYELVVECHTQNYLSLLYNLERDYKGGYYLIRFGVTIDMQTGKRVFIDDIIDTVSLKEKLLEYEYFGEFGAPISKKDADEIIHEASISEMEYFVEKTDEWGTVDMKNFFHNKSSFYLTDNQIVILRNKSEFSQELEDIFIDFAR